MKPEDHDRFKNLLKGMEFASWKGIVWHHSATKDGSERNIPAIKRYHTSYRIDGTSVTKEEYERREKAKEGKYFLMPWKDVGYHFLVERSNGMMVYEFGRPFSQDGAHAGHKTSNRFNKEYLGFCCVGNFDLAEPDSEVMDYCLEITRVFLEFLEIPKEKIIGHRETYGLLGVPMTKQCPGKFWDMDLFRKLL